MIAPLWLIDFSRKCKMKRKTVISVMLLLESSGPRRTCSLKKTDKYERCFLAKFLLKELNQSFVCIT